MDYTQRLMGLCRLMRDFLDWAPPEDELISPQEKEMLETMQSAWEEASHYLEDIVAESVKSMKESMIVQTEAGEIIVARDTNPDYPGVAVMYNPKGANDIIDLAVFESKKGDEGKGVDIYLYTDVWREDFTHKFIIDRKETLAAVGKEMEEE